MTHSIEGEQTEADLFHWLYRLHPIAVPVAGMHALPHLRQQSAEGSG